MITFKTFLEAAVDGKQPKYEDLTVEEAIATLNTHCKDALWMLHDNMPLWRGDPRVPSSSEPWFMKVDTSATERKSQNTSNYYTVLLDNIPSMANFPKRSRSFIGSTSYDRARSYGYVGNKFFIMIPYDGVKIGIVGRQDIWDTEVRLFGSSRQISDINNDWGNVFARAGIPVSESITYAHFEKLSMKVKLTPHRFIKILADCFDVAEFRVERELEKMTLLEYLNQQYSPRFTGFVSATTKDKDAIKGAVNHRSEVWVGGKIMMISYSMWNELLNSLGEE